MVHKITVYKEWLTWATERDAEYIEAYFKDKDGSTHSVAKRCNVSRAAVSKSFKRVRQRAINHGWSPEHDLVHAVPPGYHLKGSSTLYKDGKQVLQWVKTKKDADRYYDQIFDALSVLTEDFKGTSPIGPVPKAPEIDKLTVYPVVDPHVGMYAWALESGDDYNLSIAEELLLGVMNRLVDSAPKTEKALICNLGDFFHSDSDLNITARAGNKLDVDTRWSLVMRTGMKLFIKFIQIALNKHKKVDVIIDIGNHDDHTAAMLSVALDSYYENNKRVIIDMSPAKFHYYRFGKTLIGTTHGDTVKFNKLSQIMATDRPKEWGKTVHRYFFTGHIHHKEVREQPGCMVEAFNTIAPKDFFAASSGYRSKRNMVYIVMDKEHGEVERFTVDIGQLKVKK